MPVGEIAGELLGGIFRTIGYFFAEIVFEVLVKGLGYLICRLFSKKVDPDGFAAGFIGVVAWVGIGFMLFYLYKYFALQLSIDRCLDLGGSYNYETNLCTK